MSINRSLKNLYYLAYQLVYLETACTFRVAERCCSNVEQRTVCQSKADGLGHNLINKCCQF